jgi:hypothetical protein
MLHALALKGRTDLPLREHLTTKKSKNEGIARIAVLLENGKFIFPHRTQEDKNRVRVLADELLTFPLGAHDDTVMSLSIAESALLTASFAYSFALSDKVVSDNRAGTQHEEHYDEAISFLCAHKQEPSPVELRRRRFQGVYVQSEHHRAALDLPIEDHKRERGAIHSFFNAALQEEDVLRMRHYELPEGARGAYLAE